MVPLIWVAVGGTPGLLVLLVLQSLPVLVFWLHSWDLVSLCMSYQDRTQRHLGSLWLPNKLAVATAGDSWGLCPFSFTSGSLGEREVGP